MYVVVLLVVKKFFSLSNTRIVSCRFFDKVFAVLSMWSNRYCFVERVEDRVAFDATELYLEVDEELETNFAPD